MMEGLLNRRRTPGEIYDELVKQSLEGEPVTLNGEFVNIFDQ